MQGAELLGRLHVLLSDYALPVDMDENWFGNYDPSTGVQGYEALLTCLDRRDDREPAERIRADLLFKRDLQFEIAEYIQRFTGLTYNATHGDYNSLQLICGASEILSVVDFSSAHCLPVVWEVMRSYAQSAHDCAVPSHMDLRKLTEYVQRYGKHFSSGREGLGMHAVPLSVSAGKKQIRIPRIPGIRNAEQG